MTKVTEIQVEVADMSNDIIELGSAIYQIAPLPADITTMETDLAYVNRHGDVYPYFGNAPVTDDKYGYYLVGDKLKLVEAPDNLKDRYNKKSIISMNIENILDAASSLQDEDIPTIDDAEIGGEVTGVVIHPDDDFLKKAVKRAIQAKGISMKRLKNELPNRHTFDNTFGALKGDSFMSLRYFFRWVDMLDFDYEIRIRDNPNTPTKYPINGEVIARRDGEILMIPNQQDKAPSNVFGFTSEFDDADVFLLTGRKDVPVAEEYMTKKGYFMYYIRHMDGSDTPASLEVAPVIVNNYGCLFSTEKLVKGDQRELTESESLQIKEMGLSGKRETPVQFHKNMTMMKTVQDTVEGK